jgi:hypothetical protein
VTCRGAEAKGTLRGIGKATASGCTAVLQGLLALSHSVDLRNPALTAMLRALASTLTAPALASLHPVSIGAC